LDLKQEIILWKYLKPQILDEILFLAKVFLKKTVSFSPQLHPLSFLYFFSSLSPWRGRGDAHASAVEARPPASLAAGRALLSLLPFLSLPSLLLLCRLVAQRRRWHGVPCLERCGCVWPVCVVCLQRRCVFFRST
jgi:hypothetical protein